MPVFLQRRSRREGLVHFLGDPTQSIRHLADTTDYLSKREHRPDASD